MEDTNKVQLDNTKKTPVSTSMNTTTIMIGVASFVMVFILVVTLAIFSPKQYMHDEMSLTKYDRIIMNTFYPPYACSVDTFNIIPIVDRAMSRAKYKDMIVEKLFSFTKDVYLNFTKEQSAKEKSDNLLLLTKDSRVKDFIDFFKRKTLIKVENEKCVSESFEKGNIPNEDLIALDLCIVLQKIDRTTPKRVKGTTPKYKGYKAGEWHLNSGLYESYSVDHTDQKASEYKKNKDKELEKYLENNKIQRQWKGKSPKKLSEFVADLEKAIKDVDEHEAKKGSK